MRNIPNFVFNVLSLLFLLTGLIVIIQNFSAATVPFDFLTLHYEDVPQGYLLGGTFLLGALGMLMLLFKTQLFSTVDRLKSSRELEKMEVTAESSSEKVKALESKVATLEKALDDALAEKQSG